MATSLKTTIEVILKGKDLASDAFNSASSAAQNMAGGVTSATQPIADLTTNLFGLQAAITAAGGAMIGIASDKAIKLEASIVDLKKVMTEQELKTFPKYQAAIEKIGDKYALSGAEATSSVASFRQAGFGIEDALELTAVAAEAAAVSELNAAEASSVLIKQLSGFKLPASEARKYIDILNFSSNNAGSSLGLLGDATSRTAAVFKQANFSLEEQAALLEPLTTTYQRAELASSSFNTGLQRLGGNSNVVIDALEGIGVKTKNAAGEATGARDRFYQLLDVFPQLSESQQSIAAQEIFGVEQAGKLINVLTEREKIESNIKKIRDESAGSAAAEFEVFKEAAEFQLNQLGSSADNLLGAIGTEWLDGLKDSFGGAIELLQVFKGEVKGGAFDDVLKVIESNFTAVGESLSGIAKNLPAALDQVDFTGLVESFNSVFDSAFDLFGFDFSTESGLADAIQFIVDSVQTLNNVVAGAIKGLKPYVQVLKDFISDFNAKGKDAQQSIGEVLGKITGLNKLSQFAESLIGAVDGVATAIKGLAILFGGKAILGGGKFLAELFKIEGGFSGLIKSIGKIGPALATAGKTIASKAGSIATSLLGISDSFGGVGNSAGGMRNKVAASLKGFGSIIGKLAGRLTIWSTAAYAGYEGGKFLAEWIDKNLPALAEKLRYFPEKIGGWLGEIWGDIRNQGDNPEEAFEMVANQVVMLEKKLGRSIETWDEYKKAVADLKKINEANAESVDKYGNKLSDAEIAARNLNEAQKNSGKASDDLRTGVNKASGSITDLEKKMKNFNDQAEIESIKAKEVFKSINSTLTLNVDSQIQILEELIKGGDTLNTETRKNLTNFLDASQEQTKNIQEAQVGLLSKSKEKIQAEIDLLRQRQNGVDVRLDTTSIPALAEQMIKIVLEQAQIDMDGGPIIAGALR